MALSVVIPTLNEAERLPRSLPPLVPAVADGLVREVIIADGGSRDATHAVVDAAGATLVIAPRGRGPQLIAGAAAARQPWLLFLHADTALDPGWAPEVERFIARPDNAMRAAAFAFAFDDDSPPARRIQAWVALRCALFALPYGDQGLLISRSLYDALGGYRPLPLMEDVDLVRRIGKRRLARLQTRAVTSAERYRREGYLRRGARNLALLTRYLMGADPAALARAYDR